MDFRSQAYFPPRPRCLYARMRSPSPTWSRELLLLSRCCSTDCSNARAATRLKKAFTFSPVSPQNSCDPVHPYPQLQSIWTAASGYEGQGSPPLGLHGTVQCRGLDSWPSSPAGSTPLPTLATCASSFLKSLRLGFAGSILPISRY